MAQSLSLTWTEIPGWLDPREGIQLQCLATGKRVLELGSYCGRSTVCMALVAEHVTSVDWHQGDGFTRCRVGYHDTLEAFTSNLRRFGVADKVGIVRSRIEDATLYLANHSFDLVFVDADHEADRVAFDTALALQMLKPGGVIAWHDWDMPTVRQGAARMGTWEVKRVVNLAWVTP